jgi:hypothetical protein
MIVFLTLLTVVAILVLVGTLVYFLVQIITTLERIGGDSQSYGKQLSLLGKIAFGVGAIEQQTGHLGPEVTRLNQGLERAADGLGSIDRHLVGTIEAVGRQERGG